jgi:hypothetical protein
VSAYRSLDLSEASLGPVLRSHARKPRVGPAPFVLCSIAAALLWLGTFSHPVLIGGALVMSAIAMVSLVLYLGDRIRLRKNAIVAVHEKGLALRGERSTALPWEQVSAVELRRVTRVGRNPTTFSPIPGVVVFGQLTEQRWILCVRAGAEIVAEISDDYEDSTALATAIRSAIAEREVPRLLESAQGRFGPFAISEQQLEISGGGIPWGELSSVHIAGPHVVVLDDREKRRAHVPIDEVPNAHVLVTVANEMIARRAFRLE